MVAQVRSGLSVDRSLLVRDQFLAMLPRIRGQARRAFRQLDCERRDELVAEVIATAYCALVGLASRGQLERAYSTPLANYAIRRVCSGRQAATRMNRNDALSDYARRINGLSIARLDRHEEGSGQWCQLLVEDRRGGPAETAAARIDLAAWLHTLSRRNRKIAKALAVGERSSAVAKRFGLTCGRISQLRQWFCRQWQEFQGEGELTGSCSLN
jgi:hypothetical protein